MELFEPFRSAMKLGIGEGFRGAFLDRRFNVASDLPVANDVDAYARAIARAHTGRVAAARLDFERAARAFPLHVATESALLDIQERRPARVIRELGAVIPKIDAQTPEAGPLRARTHHVVGLAYGKLRDSSRSLRELLSSIDEYRRLEDRASRAQVLDTIGMLYAAQGRPDLAMSYYGRSIADKSLVGDRYGMAISLGNIGRAHLKAGRYDDALDCFSADLEIALEIGDGRGSARMMNDLGRTLLDMGRLDEAVQRLEACRNCAVAGGYPDILYFALIDLSRAEIARGRFDAALKNLDEARRPLEGFDENYLAGFHDGARGEWLAAMKRHAEAASAFLVAADRFKAASMPDQEIQFRLRVADESLAAGNRETAIRAIESAFETARQDGFSRHLGVVRRRMVQLGTASFSGSAGFAVPEIAGYTLVEPLGGGGFGEVWRAFEPDEGRTVAIKILRLSRAYDPEERRGRMLSARREADAAKLVDHPGVAKVAHFGIEPSGDPYLIQQFISGEPLSRVISASFASGTPPAERQVLEGIMNIAYALSALHEKGVVHRDVKPSNVIVRDDGTPVLIDLGIAHILEERFLFYDGETPGTASYMAPEQASGLVAVDGRADVFALGILTFEWLTGTRPDRTEEHLHHVTAARLRSLRPAAPDILTHLLLAMLAPNPTDRPTAIEVARTCAEYL